MGIANSEEGKVRGRNTKDKTQIRNREDKGQECGHEYDDGESVREREKEGRAAVAWRGRDEEDGGKGWRG